MTIAEVSKKFDLSADTLRYYERAGLIPPIGRTAGGIRDYSEDDLAWVHLAKCLRAAGLSVEAIAEYVTLYQQGDSTFERRKELLIEQRQILEVRMAEIKTAADRLDMKIERYEQWMKK